MIDEIIKDANHRMDQSISHTQGELNKVRTGRANPAILDSVQVDYFGTPTSLNQLANLSAPEPSLIIISPYDKGALSEIERAIQISDLGLSPNNDGKLIRIPIPPLTEERRKILVKQVKKLAEDHKIGIREARRPALGTLKEFESEGSLSEDARRRGEKLVQEVTDKYTNQVDEVTSKKEEEILKV